MSELLEKIRKRGYWQVIIRPAGFDEHRIPDISSLYPILERSFVAIRGWDFPQLENRDPHIDFDWIGQESECDHYLSAWRFYQSGLFVHLSGIPIDWRDQSVFWPADKLWGPGAKLGVGDVICTYLEIFEFASRLALSEAGSERMHIGIMVSNLQDRKLYVDTQRRWPFSRVYKASIDQYPDQQDLPRSQLIAAPGDIALARAIELFKRFGWVPSIDELHEWRAQMQLRS